MPFYFANKAWKITFDGCPCAFGAKSPKASTFDQILFANHLHPIGSTFPKYWAFADVDHRCSGQIVNSFGRWRDG
jgi:hypothetical protein